MFNKAANTAGILLLLASAQAVRSQTDQTSQIPTKDFRGNREGPPDTAAPSIPRSCEFSVKHWNTGMSGPTIPALTTPRSGNVPPLEAETLTGVALLPQTDLGIRFGYELGGVLVGLLIASGCIAVWGSLISADQAASEPGRWRSKGAKNNIAQSPPQATEAIPFQADAAIKDGLLTEGEYLRLKSNYVAVSDLSFALILPLLSAVFVLFPGEHYVLLPLLAASITAVLFFFSIERRHKYRSELYTLISAALAKRRREAGQGTSNRAAPPNQSGENHKPTAD